MSSKYLLDKLIKIRVLMVDGNLEKRHNKIGKGTGFGAKQLNLCTRLVTFQLRLSFPFCKMG